MFHRTIYIKQFRVGGAVVVLPTFIDITPGVIIISINIINKQKNTWR